MKTAHKFFAWIAAAALLVGLGVTISFLSFSQIGDAANDRRHAATVLRGGNQLLAALVDAETGQRGYLLTGDEAYLAPYLAVRDNVADRLKALRERTVIPEADRSLDAMVPLVDAKLAYMERTIGLRRNGDLASAITLTTSGEGKRLMNAIRTEMGTFIGLEEAALAQREAEFQLKMNRLFNSIVVASLLTVLLALAFVYFIHQQMQQGVRNLVHDETRHLLAAQEATNRQLAAGQWHLAGQRGKARRDAQLDWRRGDRHRPAGPRDAAQSARATPDRLDPGASRRQARG